MKKTCLAFLLVGLAFCAGCGSSSNNPNPPSGNFSNANLSGSYVYQLNGVDLTNGALFSEAGTFVADGKGNITSGNDDFVEPTGLFSSPISGSYGINSDGTGAIQLNFQNGGSLVLAVTIVNSTKVYLIEADSFGNGAGAAELQTTSVITTPPTGTYAFRLHSVGTASGSSAMVGTMTFSGGAITGNEDMNLAGLTASYSLTGVENSPDSNGRGTISIQDNNGTVTSLIYYVVNSTNVRFLRSDLGVTGGGRAEAQSGSFNNASLTGSYAFGSQGDTLTAVDGSKTAGVFTSNGAGTITAGDYDVAQVSGNALNVPLTGSYSAAGNGRVTLTLTPTNGGSVQEILWMVNNSRAFYLINDPNRVEDGTMDLQTASSFTNATISGPFAFFNHGFDPTDFVDRVGTITPDGAGNLSMTEFLNRTGSVTTTPIILSGTYSVGSNGRVAASIPNLSSNMIIYMISGTDGYMLQNDTSTGINGRMTHQ
jgi:hypothetical protein